MRVGPILPYGAGIDPIMSLHSPSPIETLALPDSYLIKL